MTSYPSLGLLLVLPTLLLLVAVQRADVFFVGLFGSDERSNEDEVVSSAAAEDPRIHFLAIGDWGGRSKAPYYTDAQLATAKGMGMVASQANSRFVVALGDNFYSTGVLSDRSTRFNGTFEGVYTAPSLVGIPWYVIAGNHDHYGRVQAQIDYHDRSERWVFPSLYHSHSFQTKDGSLTLDLILIDTVQLVDDDLTNTTDETFVDYPHVRPKTHAPAQWQWIEDRLSQSRADYLLVGGHYPVYSVCRHGPVPTLIEHLRPLLQKHNAHYLSGHDHCMVHYREEEGNTNTSYVLTGMGDGCCYKANNQNNKHNPANGALKWFLSAGNNDLYKAQGGFSSLNATKEHLTVKYHDQDGHVLYTADPIRPRNIGSNPVEQTIS